MMEITQKSLAVNLTESLACRLSRRCICQNYGHINENGPSVRKWPAQKMAITDKMGKNGRLSVKIQTFRTRFYGQMLQKQSSVRKSSA